MRFTLWIVFGAAVVATGALPQHDAMPPRLPHSVAVTTVVAQSFDSVGAVVEWRAPPEGGARRFPIGSYRVRIVEYGADTLAASDAAGTIDTLWLDMPPLGDSVIFYAVVATVDTTGMESGWVGSNIVTWITTPLAPLPPESVRVDTTYALVIDSLVVVGRQFEITVGDTTRLGAVLYSGSVPVACCCPELTDPIGTHPCDDVTVYSVSPMLPHGTTGVRYMRAPLFVARGSPDGAVMRLAAEGVLPLPEYQLWLRAGAL